jgi:hypothetical protein
VDQKRASSARSHILATLALVARIGDPLKITRARNAVLPKVQQQTEALTGFLATIRKPGTGFFCRRRALLRRA